VMNPKKALAFDFFFTVWSDSSEICP